MGLAAAAWTGVAVSAVGAGMSAAEGDPEAPGAGANARQAQIKADQMEMKQAPGEAEALPVRTRFPILSALPSGPLRAPQRAAWAMQYGLSETAPKPTSENLDYLRSHPDTPQAVAAARYQRMMAQENRMRAAKLVIYPLALGALLV